MNDQEEQVRYGKYVKFLVQLCKEEGSDVLLDFLNQEEDVSIATALAYMVQMHANTP